MSFTCYFCGQQQGLGIKPKKITTKIRLIITEIVERVVAEKGNFNKKLSTVWSEGREEIVEEKLACPACARKPHYPKRVEFRDESKVPVSSEAKT